ncbi:MAG: FkbM family methyltransferase [Pirellulaceae bacterium]
MQHFVVTGSGESGTGYISRLLSALGVRCGHESVFHPKTRTVDFGSFPGDASWLAAPWLAELPAGTVVLHQTRHPLDVAESFMRLRFFHDEVNQRHEPYREFVRRHSSAYEAADPLERFMRYWVQWNRAVEAAGEATGEATGEESSGGLKVFRYPVEALTPDVLLRILDLLGQPSTEQHAADALAAIDNRDLQAAHGESLEADALPRGAAREELFELAAEYGYAMPPGADAASRDSPAASQKIAPRSVAPTGKATTAAAVSQPLLRSGPMALNRSKYGWMLYNVNDAFIGRSLDLYGEWCDRELEQLGRLLTSGDVVVDAGANIGTHTVFFAQRVAPRGFVLAFEPQRLAFQNLCANVALNGLTNVDCRRAAIAAERSTVHVPFLDPGAAQNFGALSLKQQSAGEQVDALSIDELGLRRCKLLKIDVEGMEREVLLGAAETIGRLRPLLCVENNTVDRSAEILRCIHGFEYDAYWIIEPYYNPRNFFGHRRNVFAAYQPEANLLCFPAGTRVEGLLPVQDEDDNWQKASQRLTSG